MMSWASRIIVPVDVAKPSLEAVDLALRFAESGGEVIVVHVLPILTDYEAGLMLSTITEEQRADYARSAILKLLAGPQYSRVQVHVLLGDPGHEIVDFANDHKADLILLPSHVHTGIKRLLIGSVAERIVRLATCPVLVLKHPENAAGGQPAGADPA